MLRIAHAVWNGTLKAVDSLASVQQRRMGFVCLFFKQGSILASESLLHRIKDSLLERCDGKQFAKLCVISGVVLIALLTRLKENTATRKAAEAGTINTWAIFNLLLGVPSFHSLSSNECK